MQILLLVTGARGGSDFFQSLLDDHSQIIQFPGILRIDDHFSEMLNYSDPDKISKKFIKLYPYFFNSKLEMIERRGFLGINKNKSFKVNTKIFIKNFHNLLKKEKKISKIKILKNLHMAYSLTKKEKKCRKKIIFIHTHIVDYTKKFLKIINKENITIIHTMRNPISAINSPVKNWLKYKKGKYFFAKDLYFQLDVVFNGISDLKNLKRKTFVIQLEKVHTQHKKVMKDFCRIFQIKYEKCMEKPTYFGMQWWGDAVSKKWVSGVNKNFKINIDKDIFFSRDIQFFEYVGKKIIKFYKYKLFYPNSKFYFNFYPMKCELLVWKNTLVHKKWKHILSIPFFYLKRIFLINKFMVKSSNLPYSIGSKL